MAAPTLDRRTVQFLEHLHRGGLYAYWWAVKDKTKQTIWWQPGAPKPILNSRHNMYFGVNPCASIPVTNARGEPAPQIAVRGQLEHIAAINCLFAEFDAKHFDGGKAGALAHIMTLDPQPSVIVDSGGGYHTYWLLDQPFLLTTDEARTRADRAQKGWVKRVRSDDGAKDLARVLRVPGTQNFKPEYEPDFPIVSFVDVHFDRLYTFDDLEALIPPAESEPAAPPASLPIADLDATYIRRWCLAALEGEQDKMRAAGDGERHNRRYASAYALGGLVHSGGLTESEIADALAFNFGTDEAGARQTIADGIADGKEKPRDIPPPRQTAQQIAGRADDDLENLDAAQLRVLVRSARAERDYWRQESEHLDQWRDWALKVAALPTEKVSPAAKVVAMSLWPEMKSRESRGVTEPRKVWIEKDREKAGLSADTYGAKLKELDRAGAMVYQLQRNAQTGRSSVSIQPASFFQPEAWASPEPRNHGGERTKPRPAPACATCGPDAPVLEEVTVVRTAICGTCETTLGEPKFSQKRRTVWDPAEMQQTSDSAGDAPDPQFALHKETDDPIAPQIAVRVPTYVAGEVWRAIWHGPDSDEPVTVTGRWDASLSPDGRFYYQVKESSTGMPVDEVELMDLLKPAVALPAVPPILEETADLTAAIQCADRLPLALGDLQRNAFKRALVWLNRREPEKATREIDAIQDPLASAIVAHLAARPMPQGVAA